MPDAMKRCAVCGREYEANYDGCPHCAKAKAPTSAKDTAIGCIVVLVFIAILGGLMSMCSAKSEPSPSSTEAPNLAAVVRDALADQEINSYIHDVTATGDGSVIITLNVAKEDLGTDVQAGDAAQGIAGFVFSNVAGVSEVSVFDGNNKLVDIYTPK